MKVIVLEYSDIFLNVYIILSLLDLLDMLINVFGLLLKMYKINDRK